MIQLDDMVRMIRTTAQDRIMPYRYSDQAVLDAFVSSVIESIRLRPDLFLGAYAQGIVSDELKSLDPLLIRWYDPEEDVKNLPPHKKNKAAPTPPLHIPASLTRPISHFSVGLLELTDDEFASDGRAAALLTEFKRNLVKGV